MEKAKTFGLSHIAIAVKDLNRTLSFYQKVFDVEVMYQQDDFLQVTTAGSNDIIVFEKKNAAYGTTGGITHFGFRLREATDIDNMAERVTAAGGQIVDKGEFVPGEPTYFSTTRMATKWKFGMN